MPYNQRAAAFVSTLNINQHVRLADIVKADPIERQGKGGEVDTLVTSPTWPMETIDMDTDEKPSNMPPRDKTSGYNWRADLTDSTYRYDQLVQPPGLDSDKQVTTAGKLQPMHPLTHRIDEIHGRGGDSVRRLRLADSPISHHNTWEWVASHPTYDTPSGVYDGGGACVPESPAETCANRTSGAQPQCETQSGVFDGGGDRVPEKPPHVSARLRKAYIIRVNEMKNINDGLRETRDKLELDQRDKLKLCSAGTQSDDSVATE